jgi:hypothetical protein
MASAYIANGQPLVFLLIVLLVPLTGIRRFAVDHTEPVASSMTHWGW